MKQRWKTYSLQLLLSLFPVVLTSCQHDIEEDSGAATIVNVGDVIPDFTLSGSDGRDISSSLLDGQVYILNFFDTGCPDCQKEFQVLQQIYDDTHGTVPILNVPRSQSKDEIQKYWDKTGLSMPFYIPRDKNLYYKFAKRTIPRTYVINGERTVTAAFSDSPVADYETLQAHLQLASSTGKKGTANLAFKLRVPSGGGDAEAYFHNEYIITSLDIWFFNADTKKFFTKATINNLTEYIIPPLTQYDITYLLDDVKITANVYDIFVIANYDYAPDEVEDEAEFLDMVDGITYKEGIEANIPDKGPVMTSRATSLLAVDLVPWINKEYMLSVDLERVIAKLQIGVQQNTFQLTHEGTKYADINITNYKLVNLNKEYYLFQHRDSLPTLTGQPATFTLPYNFSDYSDNGEQYVVDPLFYKKTLNTSDAALFSNYYKSWFGTFTTEDFASMPSADNYGFAYILENTVFKTCQKNGYSPGIVFKAAVSPVFVYLYDNTLKTLKEEYRPEYWPNTIYLYKFHFYGSIQAVNAASSLALDELETYSDAQLKTYGIKQCKFNMGVYETYYTYWIRHRGSATDFMGPMEYGIIRNNFYRMIVTGVNGIGNSNIVPEIMRDNYPNSYADVTVDDNP